MYLVHEVGVLFEELLMCARLQAPVLLVELTWCFQVSEGVLQLSQLLLLLLLLLCPHLIGTGVTDQEVFRGHVLQH